MIIPRVLTGRYHSVRGESLHCVAGNSVADFWELLPPFPRHPRVGDFVYAEGYRLLCSDSAWSKWAHQEGCKACQSTGVLTQHNVPDCVPGQLYQLCPMCYAQPAVILLCRAGYATHIRGKETKMVGVNLCGGRGMREIPALLKLAPTALSWIESGRHVAICTYCGRQGRGTQVPGDLCDHCRRSLL